MQALTEERFYDELNREIQRLQAQVDAANPQIDVTKAREAMTELQLVLVNNAVNPPPPPNPFNPPAPNFAFQQDKNNFAKACADAINNHRNFWDTTTFPQDILSRMNPLVFSTQLTDDQFITRQTTLNQETEKFVKKPAILRNVALETVLYWDIDKLNLHLTDEAKFNKYCNKNGFVTTADKQLLQQALLEQWLNHYLSETEIDDAQPEFLALINAKDAEINNKLKAFGLKAQEAWFTQAQRDFNNQQLLQQNQQNPLPRPERQKAVPTTLFELVSSNFKTSLRIKALKKFIKAQTDIEVIRGIANLDKHYLQMAGITNINWMTEEQRTAFADQAKAKLDKMEQDDDVKKANQKEFKNKYSTFINDPLNKDFYGEKHINTIKAIFEGFTVSQQKNFLNRLDDALLEKIFQAKSEEALRHYLGVPKPDLAAEIQELLDITSRDSLLSRHFQNFLLDHHPDEPVDTAVINPLIQICYSRLGSANANHAQFKKKKDVMRAFAADLLNAGFSDFSQDANFLDLKKDLARSATFYNEISGKVIYYDNPAFCNYLLSLPKMATDLAPLVAQSSYREVVQNLLDIFKKAKNASEFKAAVASLDDGLKDSFIHLQESEFTELKNKTRTEDLVVVIRQADPDILKKKLKEEEEQFIRPLSKKFRHTQEMILVNEKNILDIRNAVRLDQFTPEHASSRSQEIKKNLTDMIDTLDKLDTDLGVQHAQWEEYRKSLVDAAPPGFASDSFADRIELIDENIRNNKNTRSFLQDFRAKNGLLSTAEARTAGKNSVLLSIQSVEDESQKHGAVKFAFTGTKATITAVPIDSAPPAPTTRPRDVGVILDDERTIDLTKEDAYVPMLKTGEMYRMQAAYLKGDDVKTVSIKKEGNKITLEQKPDKEGELEAIMKVVEWKLENHARGKPIVFNGNDKLVAKCIEVCLALKVPLEIIQIGDETTYSLADRGNFIGYGKTQDVKDAQEFVNTPAAKARIDKSLSRLKAYRPEARETFLTEQAEESSNKSKNLADDYKMYKKKNQEVAGDEADEEYRPRTPKPGTNN